MVLIHSLSKKEKSNDVVFVTTVLCSVSLNVSHSGMFYLCFIFTPLGSIMKEAGNKLERQDTETHNEICF